jgi:hypothetical protein
MWCLNLDLTRGEENVADFGTGLPIDLLYA